MTKKKPVNKLIIVNCQSNHSNAKLTKALKETLKYWETFTSSDGRTFKLIKIGIY